MSLFINPGTEPRPGTYRNASDTIGRFVQQLHHTVIAHREEGKDFEGYWAWRLQLLNSEQSVEVHVPGIEPNVIEQGEPWVSPRLYVDGSSWLWGYALDIVDDRFANT